MHSLAYPSPMVLAANAEPPEVSNELTNLADDSPMYVSEQDKHLPDGCLTEGVSMTRGVRTNRSSFDNIR